MKYFTISNSPIGRILMMSDGENLNALEAIGRRDIASDELAEKKDLPVFKSANLWLKKLSGKFCSKFHTARLSHMVK